MQRDSGAAGREQPAGAFRRRCNSVVTSPRMASSTSPHCSMGRTSQDRTHRSGTEHPPGRRRRCRRRRHRRGLDRRGPVIGPELREVLGLLAFSLRASSPWSSARRGSAVPSLLPLPSAGTIWRRPGCHRRPTGAGSYGLESSALVLAGWRTCRPAQAGFHCGSLSRAWK